MDLDRLADRHPVEVLLQHPDLDPDGREVDHLGQVLAHIDHLAGGHLRVDHGPGHRGADREGQAGQRLPGPEQFVEPLGREVERPPPGAGDGQGVAVLGQRALGVDHRLTGDDALVGRLPERGDQFLGQGDVVLRGEQVELEGVEFQALDLGQYVAGLHDLSRGDGHPGDPAGQPGGGVGVVPPRGGDRRVREDPVLDDHRLDGCGVHVHRRAGVGGQEQVARLRVRLRALRRERGVPLVGVEHHRPHRQEGRDRAPPAAGERPGVSNRCHGPPPR